MGGQLSVGAVDLRVIQVGFVHPGLEVVTHQPRRHPTEELERRDMASTPSGLVHPDHRAHEQVPRTRQHHHERPHRHPSSQWQGPTTCPASAVIDLRLTTRLHRPARHRHLLPSHLISEMCCDPTRTDDSEASTSCSSRNRCAIVATVTSSSSHSLIRSRCGAINGHVDARAAGSHSSGNHPPINSAHCFSGQRLAARLDTLGDRRGQIFADCFAVDTQRLR